ncbi:hypothetical protein AAG906_019859 [Vitis piasezkii]
MSNEFQDFLQSKGIISHRSCPSTPQQNGVAERKNHHLLYVVRTLLLDSSVPPCFWCEALSTAIHLINRLPSPMLNHVSPLSKLFDHSPLYYDLCTFGCVCFVHPPTHEQHKLTVQSVKCVFLGYAIPHKGHAMEHECWQNAMQAELQALEENHTWDIVPFFSVKLHSDGSLDRYKARLVALGNKQEYGVDYEETFAPVAKMTTIYMKLPIGMTNFSPHDVYKFKRSLYGLKRHPRLGLRSFYDSSLFFHTSVSGIVLLLVYVDDIIITGTDCASGIFMNQHKYIQDLITLVGLEDTSSVDTPMEVNVKYRKDEGDLLDDPTLYRRLVGSSPTRGLFFPTGSSLQLVAYSDANWAGCPDTHQSTTDRVFKSSTEAKYRAMSTACSEIVWLHGLLEELGFPQTTSTPLHVDNTSVIQIATNPVFHERTKHIEVNCHSIRDTLESWVISLPHIFSDLQVADVFTKALTRQQHQFLVDKVLLIDLPTSI